MTEPDYKTHLFRRHALRGDKTALNDLLNGSQVEDA
jgi:hypothetical protein